MSCSRDYYSSAGLGGTIAAVALSWITWHSIPWAIVNGLFGWFYVIYWACKYWK